MKSLELVIGSIKTLQDMRVHFASQKETLYKLDSVIADLQISVGLIAHPTRTCSCCDKVLTNQNCDELANLKADFICNECKENEECQIN